MAKAKGPTLQELATQYGWTFVDKAPYYRFSKGDWAFDYDRLGGGSFRLIWRTFYSDFRLPQDPWIGTSTREVFIAAMLPLLTEEAMTKATEAAFQKNVADAQGVVQAALAAQAQAERMVALFAAASVKP